MDGDEVTEVKDGKVRLVGRWLLGYRDEKNHNKQMNRVALNQTAKRLNTLSNCTFLSPSCLKGRQGPSVCVSTVCLSVSLSKFVSNRLRYYQFISHLSFSISGRAVSQYPV